MHQNARRAFGRFCFLCLGSGALLPACAGQTGSPPELSPSFGAASHHGRAGAAPSQMTPPPLPSIVTPPPHRRGPPPRPPHPSGPPPPTPVPTQPPPLAPPLFVRVPTPTPSPTTPPLPHIAHIVVVIQEN